MPDPAEALALLAGSTVLAVPRGTDVLPLARAWFPTAAWTHEPVSDAQVAATLPVAGARFRGMTAALVPRAGVLLLDGTTQVTGPHPADGAGVRALGLPSRDSDLYGVPASTTAVVEAWALAVARRTGGGVLPAAAGAPAVVPDPASAVDLTLWSAVPLPAADATPLVRRALSGSRLAVDARPPAGAPAGFSLTATYPYDGDVVVRCARSRAVPVVLSTLDPRAHGPWGYRVTWQPPDPLELEQDHPSALHVIARQRVAPDVARVVDTLRRVVEGTVVDSGGFVITPDELATRSRSR